MVSRFTREHDHKRPKYGTGEKATAFEGKKKYGTWLMGLRQHDDAKCVNVPAISEHMLTYTSISYVNIKFVIFFRKKNANGTMKRLRLPHFFLFLSNLKKEMNKLLASFEFRSRHTHTRNVLPWKWKMHQTAAYADASIWIFIKDNQEHKR